MLAVAGMLLIGAGAATTAAAERTSSAAEAASLAASVAQVQARNQTMAAKRAGKAKQAKKKRRKQRRLNRQIAKKIKNGHYVGYRGDGLAVDTYVCAKKLRDDAGTFRSWKVVNGKRTKRGFTAIVESKVKGGKHVFAIAKVRKQWKIGWEYFGEPRDLGNVKRTSARKECKKI